MLVVLAKLGSPQVVGKYALALAVCSPIILFSNLQLREFQATDARRDYAFGDYLALRIVCTVLALTVIVGVAALFHAEPQTAAVILFVALAKAFDSISDVVFGLLQQREQMAPVAGTLAANGVASLIATGVALWLTHSVVWAAGMSAAGSAVAVAVAWAYTARLVGTSADMRPRWHGAVLWRLTALSFPLGVVALLVSLNTNMPRYFVERHFGEYTLGIYAAMAYLIMAGTTVTAALAQSGGPRLSQRFADGDVPGFRRLLLKMMTVGGVMGAAGVLISLAAGRQVLSLMYRPEYAVAARALVWVSVAGTVAYVASFLNTAMVTVRATRTQAALFGVVAAVGFFGCAVLVPRFGLSGAAWAAGLSFAVQLCGAALIVRRSLRRRSLGLATSAETGGVR
jgi:O-antigen/teichoic acid export membrane protein